LGEAQANAVTAVIVTHTDHDFVDVTVAPIGSSTTASSAAQKPATSGHTLAAAAAASTASTPTSVKAAAASSAVNPGATAGVRSLLRRSAVGLAAGIVALAVGLGSAGSSPAHSSATSVPGVSTASWSSSTAAPAADSLALAAKTTAAATSAAQASGGGTITTTFHHPFYDETQAAFVQAQNLHVGDVLQTTTGTARITNLHLFHADTTTYDLTIGTLHTYYVVAGDTPVLVHNDTCFTDHVVLGMNPGADDLTEQLAAKDPMAHNFNGKAFGSPDPDSDGRPLWMSRVSSAIGRGTTKLSVSLDGVEGAENATDALNSLVKQGMPLVGKHFSEVYGNGTAWEMALLRLSVITGKRSFSDVDFYFGGVKQLDMTPPAWAVSD
jgi:hypothetical protein